MKVRGGSDPRHDAIASLAGLFTFFPFPLPLALAARLALPAPGAAGERFEPGVGETSGRGRPWAVGGRVNEGGTACKQAR